MVRLVVGAMPSVSVAANHLPAFASAPGVLVQFLMLTFVRKFEVLELALFFFLSSLFAAAAVAPVLSAATAAAAW